jgi:hypothetical protein
LAKLRKIREPTLLCFKIQVLCSENHIAAGYGTAGRNALVQLFQIPICTATVSFYKPHRKAHVLVLTITGNELKFPAATNTFAKVGVDFVVLCVQARIFTAIIPPLKTY